MSFTVRNHYVPQWYQRRFFPPGSSQSKLWYLDLKPAVISRPDGTRTTRRALRQLGPVNCFQEDHLYTLTFGEYATDVVEKRFFGHVDAAGEKAVSFFENYSVRDGVHKAFGGMLDYLAAQLFRTPKGLELLSRLSGSKDHQRTLHTLRSAWQMYNTIWSEAVWEVLKCENSPTKFIISDSPVCTYNRKVFPGHAEVLQLGHAGIERIGSHTLFPLGRNHCLVLTNLQYVRNPKVNPLKVRENARYFQDAVTDLRKVQRGREIEEEQVLAINYILKTHARRYVASAEREWLYPAERLRDRFWSRLGGPQFLMPDPRKVSFTTGILMSFKNGRVMGGSEYGHADLEDPRAKAARDVEWRTFQAAKAAWDERDRRAGRAPPSDLQNYR